MYVPADSPVLGRTLTLEEPPADIVLDGNAVISKYEPPVVMLALTPVNDTVPVLLIVVATAVCVPYPVGTFGNVMLDRFNDHTGAADVVAWVAGLEGDA